MHNQMVPEKVSVTIYVDTYVECSYCLIWVIKYVSLVNFH